MLEAPPGTEIGQSTFRPSMKAKILSFLSLFTSMGTLVCCALPALLVSLGMGAAVAALVTTVPWLVALSQYKAWVFMLSGSLLGLNFLLIYGLPRLRRKPDRCDVEGGGSCQTASCFSRVTLWISLGIYLIGFFMAYVFLPLKLYAESS